MPYISDSDKRREIDAIVKVHRKTLTDKGSINYLLFKLAKETCDNYGDFRSLFGELEAAKLEIYRRLVAPYEDKKIKENGDVE